MSMACPTCGVALVMSERQGVEIDYCPSCRGVWLDRGELDKIIERASRDLQPAPSAAPQTRYQESHGSHGHGYRKRRKSFLEELFD
jgi:Zn-finger nucleic acid-binding protein